jgi:hypothetical protein
MSITVCLPSFIKIGSSMAEIEIWRAFQHGCGGHVGSWRQTVGDACFGLSMSKLVCVSKFIKNGSWMTEIQPSKFFQHDDGGNLAK